MKKSRLTKAAARSAAAATEASRGIWDEAVEKAAAILAEAQRKAAPVAREAGKRTADFASRRLEVWEPHIRDALDKVPPAVDAAHGKVTTELLPNLQQALHKAAGHQIAVVPAKKRKGGKFKKFAKFVFIGSLVAGAVAAVRHFLTPKDDGWTAHEPSRAYINNNDTFATAAKFNEPVSPAGPKVAEPAAEAPKESFGEGSYVGPNPPEGYIFKGNERSKKYHVPGTRGYELTIAEVWFNSEEAAEAAGFTKAQREHGPFSRWPWPARRQPRLTSSWWCRGCRVLQWTQRIHRLITPPWRGHGMPSCWGSWPLGAPVRSGGSRRCSCRCGSDISAPVERWCGWI